MRKIHVLTSYLVQFVGYEGSPEYVDFDCVRKKIVPDAPLCTNTEQVEEEEEVLPVLAEPPLESSSNSNPPAVQELKLDESISSENLSLKSDGVKVEDYPDVDDEAVVPKFEAEYFDSGLWEHEFEINEVESWNSDVLAAFVRRVGKKQKKTAKNLFEICAQTIDEDFITAKLIFAYGPDMFRDKVLARYFRKSIKGDLKGVIKKLFDFLEDSKVSDLSYWSRLECFTEDTNEITRMFSKALLGNDLRSSLVPQSRKAIRFCAVEGMDEFTVTTMEKYVTKVSRPSQEIFKVVSFCSIDSPHIVDRNVIYVKDETYTWQMLGSVDFAQHGEAGPGHWHLNRAPDGDLMEHWGPSIAKIFHGPPHLCPLWWQLIPEGKQYRLLPDRELFRKLMQTSI